MKMVTRIAFDNMRYHRSKNVLTGIAIFLTTFLLFIVPTIGKNVIDAEYAMVNDVFPEYHASYSNVDDDMLNALSAHHDVGKWGVSCHMGSVSVMLPLTENAMEEMKLDMLYMDENGMTLSKEILSEGRLPVNENEIVVSKMDLELLGLEGEIGDIITFPYQVYRGGALDYREENSFIISGFFEKEDIGIILVSKAFLEASVPAEDICYHFLFQVAGIKHATTDDVEETISWIAEQFAIPEDDIMINTSYLMANYVDPAFILIVIVAMVIVVFAGIVTIYSIYYVSMEQRVREFGRLKAIGATKKQIKQIVLREGMLVALCAVPIGLIFGTLMTKLVLLVFANMLEGNMGTDEWIREIILKNKIAFYHWWIYGVAVVVTFITVYLSLRKPMRMAGDVSAIEAMRFHGNAENYKKARKGYTDVTVLRLAKHNIFSNRKKSLATILSMSMTGILIMVVASVLSCTSPEQMTDENFNGQYEIILETEEEDKEHPEWAWTEVQKNNPLNDTFMQEIIALNGVKRVDAFSVVDISGGPFARDGGSEDICGVPEYYAEELEKGIIKGSVTYEELKSGDKVIVDKIFFWFYPDLDIDVGSKFTFTVHDGEREYEKELEIAAIGDYRSAITNYNYLLMAKEAADSLCTHNVNRYLYVYADKDYDETLERAMDDLAWQETEGLLYVRAKQTEYDINKSALRVINSACFIFLGILGVICIMNLINTMINSVNVRRKEFGMMQAIGMSDRQLQKMLLLEGLFYTLGTLIISIGAGSLLGYGAFLLAKHEQILQIRAFTYPGIAAMIVTVTLVLVQIFLVFMLGGSLKRESVIDRVRFHE